MNHTQHGGRTRRTVARVAVTSALALMPIAAIAAPALADPVVLEPADQIDLVHNRPGHGRHGHDSWNRGRDRHDDWNRGRDRHDDWNRGRHGHDDWDHGDRGWYGRFPMPSTGSAF